MDHPENSSEYAGLQVNSGVEQPSIINPYLKRNRIRRRELTAADMVEGIMLLGFSSCWLIMDAKII